MLKVISWYKINDWMKIDEMIMESIGMKEIEFYWMRWLLTRPPSNNTQFHFTILFENGNCEWNEFVGGCGRLRAAYQSMKLIEWSAASVGCLLWLVCLRGYGPWPAMALRERKTNKKSNQRKQSKESEIKLFFLSGSLLMESMKKAERKVLIERSTKSISLTRQAHHFIPAHQPFNGGWWRMKWMGRVMGGSAACAH